MNVTGAELYFFTNEIEYFRLLNIFLFILLFYYFYFIFLSPVGFWLVCFGRGWSDAKSVLKKVIYDSLTAIAT